MRDVVMHTVSYDPLSWPGLGLALLRGRLRVDVINEQVLRRLDDLEPAEVASLVREPVGRPRSIHPDALRTVLDVALEASTRAARRHARGLRLVASDLDWTHGSGAEVHGTGEALLMAVAGRSHAVADLAGRGAEVLAGRVRQR